MSWVEFYLRPLKMTVLNGITEVLLISHPLQWAEEWVGALSIQPARALSVVPCSEMRWLPEAMRLCVSSFMFGRRSGEFFNPTNRFFLFIGWIDLSLPSLSQSKARGGEIPKSGPHLEEGSVSVVVAMGGIGLTTTPSTKDCLENVQNQSHLPVLVSGYLATVTFCYAPNCIPDVMVGSLNNLSHS